MYEIEQDQDAEIHHQRNISNKSKIYTRMCIAMISVVIVAALIVMVTIDVMNKQESNGCITSQPYNVSNIACAEYPCINEYQSYIDSISNTSISWDKQTSTEYLKTFHQTQLGKCIQSINVSCQLRPIPSCYLPPNVIEYHLSTFYQSGASSIRSTKYPANANFTKIGRAPNDYDKNGVQWVSPYNEQTQLLQNCSKLTGNRESADCVLNALGIEISESDMFANDWGNPTTINRVMQVNIHNSSLRALNLRIPSGNEQGTDSSLWRPGGYTINGSTEAVIDRIDEGQYCWNAVAAPNGSYCFDSCAIVCDDFVGCEETNCQNI